MRVVGIDPGQTGGIALLTPRTVSARVMPLLPKEEWKDAGSPIDWRTFHPLLLEWAPDIVIVERVSSMPGQGVASTFRFGSNYGGLLAVVHGLAIQCRLVVPRVWKKHVLGEDFAHDKAGAAAFVEHHHPELSLLPTPRSKKPHDGMADAICIAHYAATEHAKRMP